jgi:uncharacterized protein YecE (DUF72 family)
MRTKNDLLAIGCSGYYYPQWKGTFYPKSLKPAQWLEHYSSIFNAVELNGTFYRTPTLPALKNNYKNTPPDFCFSVKMNKYITHILRLKKSRQEILDFNALLTEGLEDKLRCILYQLPPSFHYTDENLDHILENIPHSPSSVVELRHISWWNKNVYDHFKKVSLSFCSVDHPDLPDDPVTTSSTFYMRMHGNPTLFMSDYSERALRKICRSLPRESSSNFIFFNNTYYQAAHQNALSLRKMITTSRPRFHATGAFKTARTKSRKKKQPHA